LLHLHVGIFEFLTFMAMLILACTAWRTAMYAARRRGWNNLAGAMAYIL